MDRYSVVKLPSDILRSTASNIAAIRKDLGWTQQQLSERSGVSYGSVKRFERLGQISFESLLKIAEAINRLHEFEKLFIPLDTKRINKLFETN